MKRWFSDLALGVRLALGGGRTSWLRLALTGAGIGLGVAVLLAASSVPNVLAERSARQAHQATVRGEPGENALYYRTWMTEFRADTIDVRLMRAGGPGAPVPPGVPSVPADGEMYVSPAMQRLLDSPEGELLRERFPQEVLGTIAKAGLNAPGDLVVMAGDASVPAEADTAVASFGATLDQRELDPVLTLLILVGCVVLLFPILVFVGISTRLAGAERDRRLAALRLVGAGSQRVRRIASGEALLGAFTGLAVGVALFLVGRGFVENVEIMRLSVFVGDLSPVLWMAVLICALVPVLAVATSVLAMRRTVVEPLGVVRRTKPVRRVLWWRLVPIALGAAALVTQAGAVGDTSGQFDEQVVIAGIVLLLLGIPVLLPWVVERAVGRLRGGAPSWQLAIRRLQLESGTAARVVGGVAVVLAGAIALQSVLAGVTSRVIDEPLPESDNTKLMISLHEATPELAVQAVGLVERSGGAERVSSTRSFSFHDGPDNYQSATIGTCDALRALADLPHCQDGDSFLVEDERVTRSFPSSAPGSTVTLYEYTDEGEKDRGSWTVPQYEVVRSRIATGNTTGLLLTPAVVQGQDLPMGYNTVMAEIDPAKADAVEHVRNALGPLTWRAYTYFLGAADPEERVQEFLSIRQALFAGSLITLLLAGASLLVLALEQLRERRRPLAVLAASGVPRGALARSLLWQNAVPLLLALVVSVLVGGTLAVLLLRIISEPVTLDWGGIGLLSAAAAAMVLVVTAMTLPSLRRATGALGLRSE